MLIAVDRNRAGTVNGQRSGIRWAERERGHSFTRLQCPLQITGGEDAQHRRIKHSMESIAAAGHAARGEQTHFARVPLFLGCFVFLVTCGCGGVFRKC